MESESGTNKVSDSGYSNSCSNSQSQRSGSSKSRNSGSNSSRSSGYCGGHQSTVTSSIGEVTPQPIGKRNKELKKKKSATNTVTTKADNVIIDSTILQTGVSESTEKSTKQVEEVKPCESTVSRTSNQICTTETIGQESTTVQKSTQEAESSQVDSVCGKSRKGNCSTKGLLSPASLNFPKTQQLENESVFPSVALSNTDQVPTNNSNINSNNNLSNNNNNYSTKQLLKNGNPVDDGFCCVVSMDDGVILYSTSNMTSLLGFSQDMWIGRSFIDFIHPKDRNTFTTHFMTGVTELLMNPVEQRAKESSNLLYVSLRKYRGLNTSGFGVVEKAVQYVPFYLLLTLRQLNDKVDPSSSEENEMFLVIAAVPVHSPYKVPNETQESSKFCIRHSATGEILHVDADVVGNFGFFPQDMVGKPIFNYYHYEDLPILKDIYKTVIQKSHITESLFRSRPYRFLTQNGTFALIETGWRCIVNPWSQKMEFVICHHRILQGPSNPNVFDVSQDDTIHMSEEAQRESKSIEYEIKYILNSEKRRTGEPSKHRVSKRCKDLATYMERLMNEVSKTSQVKIDMIQETEQSFSERGSVMLGEISPHHDYYDSKSSTETPPSYNQLNYNENLQRFFESKPITTVSSDEGQAGLLSVPNETDIDRKNQKYFSPMQCSGDSGSGSADNSSASNPNMDCGNTSGTNGSYYHSYRAPHLTEALLVRHNEDMEKIMARKHRDHRSGYKHELKNKALQKAGFPLSSHKNGDNQAHAHGVKRSGSYSWKGDYSKHSKYVHTEEAFKVAELSNTVTNVISSTMMRSSTINATVTESSADKQCHRSNTNVNLWPPFSVSVTPVQTTQRTTSGYATSMFPVYYIPTQAGQQPQEHPGPPSIPYQLPYVPGMVYPSIFPTPMIYSSVAMLQPIAMPIASLTSLKSTPTSVSPAPPPIPRRPNAEPNESSSNTWKSQRPASHTTSVKAEPGSAIGSIASASVANKAMSECSKRDLGVQSVCSPWSPRVSLPDQDVLEGTPAPPSAKQYETTKPQTNSNEFTATLEGDAETSDSSFYSSFLKTSLSNDESNTDKKYNNESKNKDEWTTPQKPQRPKRKNTPPWLETVSLTPELIYQYQICTKDMREILNADLQTLRTINQPELVNDQLNQLYLDLELEGLSSKLTLEDGITSSSSSGEETIGNKKKSKRRRSYSQLVMIYEENAPLPPSDESPSCRNQTSSTTFTKITTIPK